MNRALPTDAGAIETVVTEKHLVGENIVVFELAAPDDTALPGWEPGAHIDVLLPSGLIRQYSLCGDPQARTWRIAVLREPAGRGGSVWLAERLATGQTVRVTGPRNHFRFDTDHGGPVVFVAGGIGITALAPMVAAAAQAGIDYTLHYCGRSADRLVLGDELAGLHADRLVVHLTDEGSRLDVAALMSGSPPGTAVYCCGPAALLDAVETAGRAAGLDVHLERFVADTLTPPVWPDAFEVELDISGFAVTVPPDRSVLEVLEQNGVLVLSSCQEGTCGTCETPVLEGEIDHRDSILTPAERARNDVMFVCVSRAACPRIVLEL